MERPSDYIAKMNKTVMTRFNGFFSLSFLYIHIKSLYIYKYHYILYYITFA